MGKYFGTDGFRGVAGRDLTATHAYKIGRLLGSHIKNKRPRVVIGKDTRLSCDMLEAGMISGLCSVGADCYTLQVSTTPCVAFATRKGGFDFGIMISASHNPFYDNGIKIINSQGEKIGDDLIYKIEEFLDGHDNLESKEGKDLGRIYDYSEGIASYKDYLIGACGVSLSGVRVGIDASNGATYKIASDAFSSLGAMVYMINDTPNGININDGCGSTNTKMLCALVKEKELDFGFAFDGDGDRCIAVDKNGQEVDGDKIMYILARWLKENGELNGNTVVTTVMSNMGLYDALERAGIGYTQTRVGDFYVSQEIKENGFSLGGEQSGHIIISKYAPSGDGILTAIKLTEAVLCSGKGLAECGREVIPYFQESKNVHTNNKDALLSSKRILDAISKAEQEFSNKDGRILVRPSGTEPLLRIMVESRDQKKGERILDMLYKAALSEAQI